MKRGTQTTPRRMALGLLALTMMASASFAAETVIYLRADVTTMTLPTGERIPLWGFARDTGPGVMDGVTTIPGPRLEVPAGDSLRIHLKNQLTPAKTGIPTGCPASLVIPGTTTTMTPVYFTGMLPPYDIYNGRMRSLTHEAPPGGTAEYVWPTFPAGSHIYHSGTHIQCHVQMGLYGPITNDAADGGAYPGVAYDNEVILFYHEIDPEFHSAVATRNYGPGTSMTSTVNYSPQHFLVNGSPFTGDPRNPGAAPIVDHPIAVGERVLFRLFNAGLETHVPTWQNFYGRILAEDGHPYLYPKEQYSVNLPALQTIDMLVTATNIGLSPIYDRAMHLTGSTMGTGGMMTFVRFPSLPAPPVANVDAWSTTEGVTLNVPAPGVLANDSDPNWDVLTANLVTTASLGAVTLNSDGSFSYVPNPDVIGIDRFWYVANDGTANSAPTTVTIVIASSNRPPVAHPDPIAVTAAQMVFLPPQGVTGNVLANDTDLDGDPLTAALVSSVAMGSLTINADGSFAYVPAIKAVNFNNYVVAAYATPFSQDGVGTVSKLDGGATLRLTGNKWQKIDLPYTVTANTILEFDFRSTILAEFHGIGFDNNQFYTANTIFVLGGSQPYSTANNTYNNYNPSLGAWKHFTIPVGQHYTGAMTYLFFLNDQDAANASVNGSFRNVMVYENGALSQQFTYKANDGTTDSNVAAVTITVATNVGNTAPTANPDLYNVTSGQSLNVPAPGVLGNDTDPDGNGLTASVVAAPTSGTLTLNANGSFVYTPNGGFVGTDSFTYQVSDGLANSNVVAVSITVTPPVLNGPPVATNDAYNVAAGSTLNVAAPGVLGNDSDPDGNPMQAQLVTNVAFGSLTLNANGSFTYTPAVTAVNFNNYTVGPYATPFGQDGVGTVSILDAGATLQLTGNKWQKIDLPYTVTANTILEFDFRSTNRAEFHGVGLDNDQNYTANTIFVLGGTQSYSTANNVYNAYGAGSVGTTMHFTIAVGQHYGVVGALGAKQYLFFINDQDASNPAVNGQFSNVRIYENGAKTPSFTYRATDGQATSNLATVNITVN